MSKLCYNQMLHALLFLTKKSNKKQSENLSFLKQYPFVLTYLGNEFVEKILKSRNPELKTMMRRKMKRKEKMREGEWKGEKVSGAEKGK